MSEENKMTEARPEWLEAPDLKYSLNITIPSKLDNFEEDITDTEEVPLTRGEYIALKKHLAELRGIAA